MKYRYSECEYFNRVFCLRDGKVYSAQLRKVEWRWGYGFVRLHRMPYKNVERRWYDESEGVTYYYGRRLFGL
jgi:hypothetical protein